MKKQHTLTHQQTTQAMKQIMSEQISNILELLVQSQQTRFRESKAPRARALSTRNAARLRSFCLSNYYIYNQPNKQTNKQTARNQTNKQSRKKSNKQTNKKSNQQTISA
jgi:hypothetical protein